MHQAPKIMATSGVFRAEVDSENPWVASCRVGVPYDLDRAYKVTMKALLRIFELGRTATAFERDWCGLKSLFQTGTPWLLKAQEVLVYPSGAKLFIPQVRHGQAIEQPHITGALLRDISCSVCHPHDPSGLLLTGVYPSDWMVPV